MENAHLHIREHFRTFVRIPRTHMHTYLRICVHVRMPRAVLDLNFENREHFHFQHLKSCAMHGSKEKNMIISRTQNLISPKAAACFRRTNRYLMDENTRPCPTMVFLSMEEAADLLAYRYKTASRMTRARLESRVNFVATQEQNARKVACHCRFVVVGLDSVFDALAYLEEPVVDTGEHRLACGAAYEARQAQDDRVRSFRRTF